MKNRKGFTIVELVIVIAVIAILAAVLIPTFSGIVNKANESSALQVATSTMKSTLAMSDYGTISPLTQFVIVRDGTVANKFQFKDNKIEAIAADATVLENFNSIIVGKAFFVLANDVITNAIKKEQIANINAATGFSIPTNVDLTLTPMSDGSGYTFTLGTGTEAKTYKLYYNTDYADDVITVTKSN